MKDACIINLDRIVSEVKQTEEWEAVKINILEIGMAKGEEIGRKEGQEKGEDRVNHLIQLLINQTRTDEIEKAVTDKDFQQTLFAEFGI